MYIITCIMYINISCPWCCNFYIKEIVNRKKYLKSFMQKELSKSFKEGLIFEKKKNLL